MSDLGDRAGVVSGGGYGGGIDVAALPKTAVQALYHAATGKTENLSREFDGNVIIKGRDIERLYDIIIDQLRLYKIVAGPTVTVVVKNTNKKSTTYSSWERFSCLMTSGSDVTSEVILRFEFIISVPNTCIDQRCIINVGLDSSLPLLCKRDEDSSDAESLGFILFMKKKWRSVSVSIDFVDFLIAKSFVNIVEEWFSSLEKTPENKLNDILFEWFDVSRSLLGQTGRLGMAAFFCGYALFSSVSDLSFRSVSFAISIGLLISAIFYIAESSVAKSVFKRVSANIIPAVILISDADDRAYANVIKTMNAPIATLASVFMTVVISFIVNIASSYAYAFFTKS